MISDVNTAPKRDARQMWAYSEILKGLMRDTPVLPARYGTLGEEGEIEAMLTAREGELTRALDRVGDAVEFVVHTPDPAESPAFPTGSTRGREYLRRRGECERMLRDLMAITSPFLRCPPRRLAHGFACLVDPDGVEGFACRVAEHGATAYGPWPPFTFVT